MARHCSFCYGSGHNRATCPEKKRRIRENPDSHMARVERDKKARRANRTPQRRECGYCNETGHNKRTCPKLGKDRTMTARNNKKFAKDFVTTCKKLGFGPGTLMQVALPENLRGYTASTAENMHEKGNSLAMVIGWGEKNLNSDLTQPDQYLGYKDNVVRVRFPSGRHSLVPLPLEFQNLVKGSENTRNGMWLIGCPIDASAMHKSLSAEWHTGEKSVDYQLGLEE